MTIALIFACVMNIGSYWFSDKIVIKMTRAKEVSRTEAPRYHEMVDRMCQRAQLPKPKLYVLPDHNLNAFATGRNPANAAVAVTQGLLEHLSEGEVSGVIGHELAHIKNRDTLISAIAATLAGAISMLANMAQWAMIFGSGRSNDGERNPFAGLIMIIIAPIAAMLIQMAISRSREYKADQIGAQIHGNPLDLANALRKLKTHGQRIQTTDVQPATAHMYIINPLRGRSMANLFSTHPNTEERIRRLEEQAKNPAKA